MPEGMAQSKRVDVSTMEALGDLASAAAEFKRLADQIRRDAKKTGNVLSDEQAHKLTGYQSNYERLMRKIAAEEAKKYADTEAKKIQSVMQRDRDQRVKEVERRVRIDRQDRRAQAQEERHFYKHSNIFQRLRDFTGHATQKGYIDYVRGLAGGNIQTTDLERIGGGMVAARRVALRIGGKAFARSVVGAGQKMARIGMLASGPGALAAAGTGYVVEKMQQEVENQRDIAASRMELSETLFRQSRSGSMTARSFDEILQKSRESKEGREAIAIGGQVGGKYREWINKQFGATMAQTKGESQSVVGARVEEFEKLTGMNLSGIEKELKKAARNRAMAIKFPGLGGGNWYEEGRKVFDNIRSGAMYIATDGGSIDDLTEDQLTDLKNKYMSGIMKQRADAVEFLATVPERKIEIAQQRLYNSAVADMEVKRWCQWNPN